MRRRFWEGVLDGPIAEALTHRDHAQTCVFVTGHGKDGRLALDWASLIQPRQTPAVQMGLRNLEPLTETLTAHGRMCAAESKAAGVRQSPCLLPSPGG